MMIYSRFNRNKYHAKKTILDGITFDSAKEANRFLELKLLERCGEISNLERQVIYELQPKFDCAMGHIRAITYRADFRYAEDGKTVVEDVKGFKTKEYNLKRKMFLRNYPEVDFREV